MLIYSIWTDDIRADADLPPRGFHCELPLISPHFMATVHNDNINT
jgi:hypothetical protein